MKYTSELPKPSDVPYYNRTRDRKRGVVLTPEQLNAQRPTGSRASRIGKRAHAERRITEATKRMMAGG